MWQKTVMVAAAANSRFRENFMIVFLVKVVVFFSGLSWAQHLQREARRFVTANF
jgi:hypothetical protein